MSSAPRQRALQRILTSAWLRRGLMAWVLWPVALLFGALAAIRRGMYRVGWLKVERVPVPLIVVGNVVVGGSGKTPVVMAVVRHLQARAMRVGVISRGYGRHATDCREVLGDSPISDVGDEPALIKRVTAAPVFVANRRLDAARALLKRYPDTQIIVCDDGLQHLSLGRDLEICVFDDRGTGNGFLLPAGPLREHWPRPVDMVLHTGSHPAFAGFTAHRMLARHAIGADGRQIALTELAHSKAKPLLAVAAIAKPDDFFAMLRSLGLNLARTIALPDHDDFARWESNEYGGYTVVCTEKDAAKLWQKQPDALAAPLILAPEPAFMTQLDALLAHRLDPALSLTHGHTTS